MRRTGVLVRRQRPQGQAGTVNAIVENLKAFGAPRLAAMGAIALGLVGIFAFLMLRLGEPAMAPLFTDLTFEDSAAIMADLDAQAVPYEVRREGAVILVPEDRVLRLRMTFAGDGKPSGGVVGYEIFDDSSTLGTTSFVQNINRTRALEGELARTIRSIDRVQMARVHLVQPERQLFSRDRAEPSASIVVKVRGMLDPIQIRAVQNLVASAVENLKPERISIVDEAGRLLASGRDSEGMSYLASTLDERTMEVENRLREQITGIISNVVGPGRARVEVAAELDFNRVTQTSDIYDPDGRVVRSTQTREDVTQASDTAPQEGVTVANELPNADGTGTETVGSSENATVSEEIVNYEISRTTRTEVIEAGRTKRISVAVLVDGVYTATPDGQFDYAPRPQEDIDRIATLVRSAIGFDQQRGDTVEVVNMRFAEPIAPPVLAETDTLFLGFTRPDAIRLAETGILLVIALLVLLVVVRPLIRRILDGERDRPAEPEPAAILATPADQSALPKPDQGAAAADQSNKALEMIDVAKVNGEVQASTVKRVGNLVDTNPDEAVTIVRQWMGQAA